MSIELRPIDEPAARRVVAWQYDPPYDAYNIVDDVEGTVEYLQQADVHCHVLEEDGELIGFCTFGRDAQIPGGDYSEEALDLGLGVRPDLTGQGRGHQYVQAVVAHALAELLQLQLRVSIAAWNDRALRAWSSAGFVEVERFTTPGPVMSSREFVVLIRPV